MLTNLEIPFLIEFDDLSYVACFEKGSKLSQTLNDLSLTWDFHLLSQDRRLHERLVPDATRPLGAAHGGHTGRHLHAAAERRFEQRRPRPHQARQQFQGRPDCGLPVRRRRRRRRDRKRDVGLRNRRRRRRRLSSHNPAQASFAADDDTTAAAQERDGGGGGGGRRRRYRWDQPLLLMTEAGSGGGRRPAAAAAGGRRGGPGAADHRAEHGLHGRPGVRRLRDRGARGQIELGQRRPEAEKGKCACSGRRRRRPDRFRDSGVSSTEAQVPGGGLRGTAEPRLQEGVLHALSEFLGKVERTARAAEHADCDGAILQLFYSCSLYFVAPQQ